jgi:hypothetical protein
VALWLPGGPKVPFWAHRVTQGGGRLYLCSYRAPQLCRESNKSNHSQQSNQQNNSLSLLFALCMPHIAVPQLQLYR